MPNRANAVIAVYAAVSAVIVISAGAVPLPDLDTIHTSATMSMTCMAETMTLL